IFRNEKGEFEVEVIESRRFSLRVNPVYRQLVGQLQAARSAGAAAPAMTDDELQHIRQYVTRAKFFIDNINQRRQTIGRITDVIVDCQKDFLEKGVQSLRPLTRAEVGERIGMHESTVSRATAGKFVLLPAGEVIPFSTFFTASLGVKDVIKNIIEAEDHSRPYSDQEIVEKLREEHGIRLARRTVAKYREELQILPARLRKRWAGPTAPCARRTRGSRAQWDPRPYVAEGGAREHVSPSDGVPGPLVRSGDLSLGRVRFGGRRAKSLRDFVYGCRLDVIAEGCPAHAWQVLTTHRVAQGVLPPADLSRELGGRQPVAVLALGLLRSISLRLGL